MKKWPQLKYLENAFIYIQVGVEYTIEKRLKQVGYVLELYIVEIDTHSFARIRTEFLKCCNFLFTFQIHHS